MGLARRARTRYFAPVMLGLAVFNIVASERRTADWLISVVYGMIAFDYWIMLGVYRLLRRQESEERHH